MSKNSLGLIEIKQFIVIFDLYVVILLMTDNLL